ncbi:MAG: hypothetical protein EOP41_05455 [Sphingobacteriaceae bacterium]|nr:MAG: hypothetical protein EOP41_05455 [Sphingobacteriaceae bacterium]
MRNFVCTVIGLFAAALASGQLKTEPVALADLPKNVHYQGKPMQAVQFQDKTGNYLALSTQTGSLPQNGNDEFRQAHVYGYVYQLKDKATPVLLWQLHDLVTECNLDMEAAFIPGSFAVTDLDKNGKAEVWLTYRLACRGDISPAELKIIMHEGTTKYAMRGIGRLKVGKITQHDGGLILSSSFNKAPAGFRQYAGKLWNKYVQETIN